MLQAEAASTINQCLSGVYHAGIFIPSCQAITLAKQGLLFLTRYKELAEIAYSRKQRRFPFVPKGHYLHHQFLDMLHQGQRCPFAMNILVFACQPQEDFVGKPSRISRRTNPRTCHRRVIERVFLSIRNALQAQSSNEDPEY